MPSDCLIAIPSSCPNIVTSPCSVSVQLSCPVMLLHPVIFPMALHGALQSCYDGCLLWVFYQGKGSNVRGRTRGVHGRNGMEAGQGLRWRQGLGLGLTETNGDMDEASKAGAVTIPKNVACNNLNPNCVSFKSKTVFIANMYPQPCPVLDDPDTIPNTNMTLPPHIISSHPKNDTILTVKILVILLAPRF